MSIEHTTSLIGCVIGNYLVERLKTREHLISLYEARHLEQDTPATITFFTIPESLSPSARRHFVASYMQRMEVLFDLHHPHIVPIHQYGEDADQIYLVTPQTTDYSLADALAQGQRLTPVQTATLLKQVASGLDYAHSQGIVHGTLRPAVLLLHSEGEFQITTFELIQMLVMWGSEHLDAGEQHIQAMVLDVLKYWAPESTQDQPLDVRSDIYSLGMIIFESLSGGIPWRDISQETAIEPQVEQPFLSLQELCPDVPASIERVISKALERDPERRFQSAGALADAFERALKLAIRTQTAPLPAISVQSTTPSMFPSSSVTAPDRHTGPLPAVTATQQPISTTMPIQQPTSTVAPAWQPAPLPTEAPFLNENHENHDTPFDPFDWWSASSLTQADMTKIKQAEPRQTGKIPAVRSNRKKTGQSNISRRTVITQIASGVVALGTIGFAIGATRLSQTPNTLTGTRHGLTATPQQSMSYVAPTQPLNTPATAPTQAVPTAQPTATSATTPVQAVPTTQPTVMPTAVPQAQPTSTQAPSPTVDSGIPPIATQAPPTPLPTAIPPTPTSIPQHTGTVIGNTNQATNSAANFTNPADNQSALLIHLPNGNFSAFETVCPHEGAMVVYDSGQQRIACTRHVQFYNAASGASIPGGITPLSLTTVAIQVNADGTITVSG
ncbi:MAG TPA: protein kinase [Ktedonosporobacter sp.]|nr:protein kinase [Ktedonosporobacter sp.]